MIKWCQNYQIATVCWHSIWGYKHRCNELRWTDSSSSRASKLKQTVRKKETAPYFPQSSQHGQQSAWRALPWICFKGLFLDCVKKAERILIESYHIVLYFEAISMPKNAVFHMPVRAPQSMQTATVIILSHSLRHANFQIVFWSPFIFSCSPSTIPLLPHMVVLSILPMHLRQFLLPHLRFHLL